jgi:DNA invertase Pin-like site-specific DNA recombinase
VNTRRIAISYSRFSDPVQAKGDSEDRQEKDFRNFCRRHNLTPLSEVYIDRGRSGYRDEHRKKGRLGQLIAAAKDDRFERGTIIVVEAWDRLGRLRPDKQTELVAELLRTGVSIGICRLDDIFTEDDFGTHKWAMLSTFIMLAYQESKQKADRICSSWERRRRLARENGAVMTPQLPGWLQLVNGAIVPIPERVAVVKRVFRQSAAGYGRARIVATLTKENVATFGDAGKWSCSYIGKILNDRRVLGELQPRKDDDTPVGAVLPNYYPRVVSDDDYALARAGQASRSTECEGWGRHRDRKYVNVFQSILTSAIDGGGFILNNHGSRAKPRLVLANSDGVAGRAKGQTFPYDVLEEAVLGQLAEVNPADVLPRQADEASRADVLRAKLAVVRQDIRDLQADLKGGYSRAISAVLREREDEEERIAGELQDELARSARPAERAWNDLPSLVGMIKKHGDEARLKIRPVLRGIVKEARLLLVRRHSWQLAAVQFFFVGDAVRSYLVVCQYPGHNRPRRWWPPWSLREVIEEGEMDLRQKADALALEAELREYDLEKLGVITARKRKSRSRALAATS